MAKEVSLERKQYGTEKRIVDKRAAQIVGEAEDMPVRRYGDIKRLPANLDEFNTLDASTSPPGTGRVHREVLKQLRKKVKKS